MKRTLLSILILSISLTLFGNPVDENTAKQLAQNFWKENNIMGVKGDKVFKKKMDDARFVNVATRCGYSEFYIFNNEDGKGFVILAADDCVTPILGYSYENNFAAENLPPNLKGWLDGYAEQIRAAVEMRATATEEIRTEWECLRQGRNLPIKSETEVDHLLSTTWDQNYPYNILCPEDPDANGNPTYGYVYAGCEACAMAQILKFWEYPNDAHSVIYHEYEHPVYGLLDANYSYSGGSYYWNFMPNQLTSSSSTNQRIAIASLMYHCGVSVEMNYGPSGSGAYSSAAEIAFRAFFDYNNATLETKSSYTDTQWISLIKNELDNGRPVFYSGSGTGGHAFVCDGYNNSNYFWFNWGWSGQANGYFPVNSLTPITTDGYQQYQHDYSNNQQAIIGIEPGGTNSYHLLGMNDDIKLNGYYGDIYCFDTQIQEITTEVYNWGNTAFNGSLCAVVYDGSGQYMAASELIDNCQILPMQSSGQLSFTFSEPLNILSCKAYIGIFAIENDQATLVSQYGMHKNPSEFYNYYTNSSDMVELYLYSNIEYSPSSIVQNSAINVTANITNDDNDPNLTFYGYYAAALYDLNGELKQILATLHEVNGLHSGYHYTSPLTFSCPSVNVPTGTYYLTIIQQSEGSDTWYPLLNWEDCDNPEFVNPIRIEVVGPITYTVTATPNPNNGGNITGQGNYFAGETCTLTATANNGYTFINWTENGTQVSNNTNYTFTVSGNRNLVANFQALPQQYTVNVSADPTNGGFVSISGELSYDFDNGFSGWTTIDADGDGFNWITGNELMGTGYGHNGSNDLLLSQSYDNNYGALYPDNYLVSPQVVMGGSISFWACAQDDAYASEHFGVAISTTSNTNANSFTTIQEWTMTAKGEGRFSNHSRDGNNRSQGNWHQYIVDLSAYSGQTGYIAIRHFNCSDMFYLDIDDVTIHPAGSNTYYQGQSCTVHAIANSGYTFVNWTENGTQVSTNANYTFTVTGNRSLVAHFQQQQQQYTISVLANPNNGGSVSGGGTFNQGASCTVHATANSGYTFVNWTEDGTQVSTNPSYSFTVNGNRNLVANFQAQTQQYTISVSANPNNGGSVSGGGTFNQGASCTVHATANNGYTFTNWTENGTQVSTNANYTFMVTGNRNLVANFSQSTYTITATAGANGFITPSGTVVVAGGSNQTFTIIPDYGYEVYEVYVDGGLIGAPSSYTFQNVTSNHTIFATFIRIDGIDDNDGMAFVIYPNPTSGIVNILCQDAELFNIYNTFGQLLINQTTNGNDQVTIDISSLPSGIYLIQLVSKEGLATKQIIKIP